MKLTYNKRAYFYALVMMACLCSLYAGLVDLDYYWQADLGMHELRFLDFNWCRNQVWGTKGLGEYLDHEWLCNIFFYLLYGFGEYRVLVTKFFISLITGITLIWYIRHEKKDLKDWQCITLVMVILTYSLIFLKVKAYSVSFLFVLVEIVLLREYSSEVGHKTFIKLLALCILWSNFHSGSVPIFFVIAGTFYLFQYRTKKVFAYGVLCFLSTFLNPYGYRLMLFNMTHFFDKTMKSIIRDWDGIDLSKPIGVAVFILIFMLVYLMIKTKEKAIEEVVLVILMIYMSISSIRHTIYLFPFLILYICRADLDFKLRVDWRCAGVVGLFVCILSVQSGIRDKEGYNFRYMSPELEQLVLDTCNGDSTGLFSDGDSSSVLPLGLKDFRTGAYPLVASRTQDCLTLTAYGGVDSIKRIIEYYGLDKFLFCRWNLHTEYYDITNPLYDYLSSSPEYELLYDSDFLCYFVRKD